MSYIFTLTAGRTGTAWLADFLTTNSEIPAIHEPLGIDDFGINMPDIRTMRAFNDRNSDQLVENFWTNKLKRIDELGAYIETNHTLGKCGLIEAISSSALAAKTKIIILRRNKVNQCLSYLNRGDFMNITTAWQWYLSPNYKNNIINFQTFGKLGHLGKALWYVLEIEARQAYYMALFSSKIEFIEFDLEDVTKTTGANRLLNCLGIKKEAKLPPKANEYKVAENEEMKNNVTEIVKKVEFDASALAKQYIDTGRRLSGLFPN